MGAFGSACVDGFEGVLFFKITQTVPLDVRAADNPSTHVRRLTIQAPFLKAHNAYVQHHRTVVIPLGFVVPSDSPDWPLELHRMELGKEARGYR